VQRQVAELKHLSRPRKRDYSLSSGERTGKSPNLSCVNKKGVKDHRKRVRNQRLDKRIWKDLPERVKAPYSKASGSDGIQSSAGHEKSGVK
jgi:hypothetical protein